MCMITIMLKFGQALLTVGQALLLFCLSYSFFRLKTPVDLSNLGESDLNFFKWSLLVVFTLG